MKKAPPFKAPDRFPDRASKDLAEDEMVRQALSALAARPNNSPQILRCLSKETGGEESIMIVAVQADQETIMQLMGGFGEVLDTVLGEDNTG